MTCVKQQGDKNVYYVGTYAARHSPSHSYPDTAHIPNQTGSVQCIPANNLLFF